MTASYEEIAITDSAAGLRAVFVPAAGMLCTRLEARGVNVLAQNDGVEAYAERGKTMGIPLLYPWANRLAQHEYDAAGAHVSLPDDPGLIAVDDAGLPIHGVVPGHLRWRVAERSGASLVANLEWAPALGPAYGCFPFEHEVRYSARFAAGRLQVEVTVLAGEAAVPVSFGFHPYIAPGGDRSAFHLELPEMRHLELDARQLPTGSGTLQRATAFELAGQAFDDGYDTVALPARFSVAGTARRVTVDFEHGYQCAQLYAPQGRDFVCFEPMCAHTAALEHDPPLLAPGERFAAAFSLAAA